MSNKKYYLFGLISKRTRQATKQVTKWVTKMGVTLRRKSLANGKQSLYLDIYHAGKRQYEFLNLYLTKDRKANKETLQLAESIRAKRQLEIQNSEHGFIPHFKRKDNFVTYFEKIVSTKPKTEKAWPNTLKYLREYTGGSIRFSAINDTWLEQFKSFLLIKLSNNTAHTYFSKIKAALRQAVKDKILLSNPADTVSQIKKTESKREFLTLGQVQDLAKTPCSLSEIKRAFLFSCFTGLRLSDVESLTWENIKDNSIEFTQQKTKGNEYLPMSETALGLLHPESDSNILPMPNQKVFNLPSRTMIAKTLKQWKQQAGLEKNFTFHTARHTFATLALTQGVDLYTVSKLLGHKSIQATQIYAKIIDEKKQEAVDRLPVIKV